MEINVYNKCFGVIYDQYWNIYKKIWFATRSIWGLHHLKMSLVWEISPSWETNTYFSRRSIRHSPRKARSHPLSLFQNGDSLTPSSPQDTCKQWKSIFSILWDEVASSFPSVAVPIASHTSPAFPVSCIPSISTNDHGNDFKTEGKCKSSNCSWTGCKTHTQSKTSSHTLSAGTHAVDHCRYYCYWHSHREYSQESWRGVVLIAQEIHLNNNQFRNTLPRSSAASEKGRRNETRKEHCVPCNRILKTCSRPVRI